MRGLWCRQRVIANVVLLFARTPMNVNLRGQNVNASVPVAEVPPIADSGTAEVLSSGCFGVPFLRARRGNEKLCAQFRSSNEYRAF